MYMYTVHHTLIYTSTYNITIIEIQSTCTMYIKSTCVYVQMSGVEFSCLSHMVDTSTHVHAQYNMQLWAVLHQRKIVFKMDVHGHAHIHMCV